MKSRVLIIGGYGNFGRVISRAIAGDKNIQLIIAGRCERKALELCQTLDAVSPPEAAAFDIQADLDSVFSRLKPDIVIHTSGPFQGQSYRVAKACIEHASHYIDLADGRDFVSGITALDKGAKAKDVLIVSGASSVPCLSSAIVDKYQAEFNCLESLDYGITTAQKASRGRATTAAILSYVGKPFFSIKDAKPQRVFGWQNLRLRRYPQIGNRWLSDCDIPDLTIFPRRYPTLKTLRFSAGLELSVLHLTLWLMSWAVRLRFVKTLQNWSPWMFAVARRFDAFGGDTSALHVTMQGKGQNQQPLSLCFNLIAGSGDGPLIPSVPSILLAKKLAAGKIKQRGALPCVGLIDLEEYLCALKPMDIRWFTERS